ncbi:MAG: NAD(P)/FAD-dependent oxidoreductase [Candidatus Kapabacteria bacterium]|nr:NAD(P)/FAD-dependent oxidoreductase [Candidatus Kapabacteria bacterium]
MQTNDSSSTFDVVIIGAGAAGLMCAAVAGRRGRKTLLIEHAEKVGKKILISGGGRCNFTNLHTSPANYLSENPHFCKSALSRYTPHDFIALVEQYGITYHEKTLGQLFCDDSSRQIVQMLESECRAGGVECWTGCDVQSVAENNHETVRFLLETTRGMVSAESLVIATGGLSIPKMGATDFGQRLAKQFGLRLTPMKPALVPITTNEAQTSFGAISGVSLDAIAECGGVAFRENILFTHRGMSGPAILQASSYWERGNAMTLNTAPTLDFEHLWQENRSTTTTLKNVLAQHLPKRFVEAFCDEYAHDLANTPFSNLPLKGYKALTERLHAWCITPNGTEGYAKAEVTAGGVDTNELSSKTMESKNVHGLYFIGEVVDVTGWLGGYNFQWAWASGVAAGQAA